MDTTSTRKLLINVATIINIIYAVIIILCGVFFLFCSSLVTYDLVVEILAEDGSIAEFSESEINSILSITKNTFIFGGIYCLIISALQLGFSIVLNNKNSAFKENKGLIITLLVLSLFTGNLLSVGLLIGALCIKVEKNMDDIFNELEKNVNSDNSNLQAIEGEDINKDKQ